MSHATPGHCFDSDFYLYHQPGQCPGAILNCSGNYCSTTEAPAADDWCREESCRHRHWRSGSMPTHKRGDDCPATTEAPTEGETR